MLSKPEMEMDAKRYESNKQMLYVCQLDFCPVILPNVGGLHCKLLVTGQRKAWNVQALPTTGRVLSYSKVESLPSQTFDISHANSACSNLISQPDQQ